MKRALSIGLLSTALALVMATPGDAGQRDDEFLNEPGYIDFGDVRKFSNDDESIEVYLTQPLLAFVKAIIEKEEPELGTLIDDLALVKVDVFSFDWEDFDALEAHAGGIAGGLGEKGWQQIVKVKSDEERVFVHVLPIREEWDGEMKDIIAGVTVVALEEEEAVFVNIVGKFDVAAIGQLMGRFDVPHIDIDDLPEEYRGTSRSSRRRDRDDDDDDWGER